MQELVRSLLLHVLHVRISVRPKSQKGGEWGRSGMTYGEEGARTEKMEGQGKERPQRQRVSGTVERKSISRASFGFTKHSSRTSSISTVLDGILGSVRVQRLYVREKTGTWYRCACSLTCLCSPRKQKTNFTLGPSSQLSLAHHPLFFFRLHYSSGTCSCRR